jgi:hypothetical protein
VTESFRVRSTGYQRVRIGYCETNGSGVNMVRPPATAWQINIRIERVAVKFWNLGQVESFFFAQGETTNSMGQRGKLKISEGILHGNFPGGDNT